MVAIQEESQDVGARKAVFTQVYLLHVAKIHLHLEAK